LCLSKGRQKQEDLTELVNVDAEEQEEDGQHLLEDDGNTRDGEEQVIDVVSESSL